MSVCTQFSTVLVLYWYMYMINSAANECAQAATMLTMAALVQGQHKPAAATASPVNSIRPYAEIKRMYDSAHSRLAQLVREAYAHGHLAEHSPCNLTLDEFLGHAHHGSIRRDRAASHATFVDMCRPKRLLEIGSFLGLSSNFYLRLLEAWNGKVVSVDPNIPHRCFVWPRRFYRRMNTGARVKTVDGFWALSTGERNTISPAYFSSRGETFDMAFIDGNHDEEAVLRDVRGLAPLMRGGAA